MEETKRKTHTSTAVKRRYNQKAYKSITVQVKPELAARIAAYREREGLSMAKFLERAVDRLEQGETVIGSSIGTPFWHLPPDCHSGYPS